MNGIEKAKELLYEHTKELMKEGTYPVHFVGYVALVDIIRDVMLAANGCITYEDTIHGEDVHDLSCYIADKIVGKEV